MENQTKLKWYQKPKGVIILLILFFPVGLYQMWKNELWTKKTRWIATGIVAVMFIASSGNNNNSNVKNSKKTSNNLVGQTFSLDAYHSIKFKTKTRYWIYQNPLNCGGEGNWSIENKNIILGPNDSNCESTRAMKGSYNLNKF